MFIVILRCFKTGREFCGSGPTAGFAFDDAAQLVSAAGLEWRECEVMSVSNGVLVPMVPS